MSRARAAWDRVVALGNTLDALLALYLVTTTLAALAWVAYRALGSYKYVQDVVFYGGVLLAAACLMLIPFLLREERVWSKRRMNPDLVLESFGVTGTIRKNKMRVIEVRSVSAIRRCEHLTFGVFLTGSGKYRVRLKSAGSLRGPVKRGSWDYWQVVFPSPLEKNAKYVAQLQIDADDPEGTMHPLLGMNATNYAKYGTCSLKVEFPEDQPSAVYKWRQFGLSGAPMEPVEDIFLNEAHTATPWSNEKAKEGYGYIASWKWA